ncbi:Cell surface glycoprotein CD200 receptor 1 [Tupaia chinensis]|uniref:Cell surface glycoprotein CD200 receptor 1 n=1 Tax=Tupaia chinensis TaxID=246437 RepID=L9KC12_TUPCH|nr:Cell surface glycoprotein CD200 receptor 1 [Tupaia chinensis]
MPCPWRTSDLVLLLSLTIFVAALNSSCTNGKETTLNNSVPPTEVDIPLFVLMNSKAVLCCPPVSRTYMIGATWEIILRDKPACIKAYKADSNETKDVNCTDRRITWVSRPDQNLSLRIDPVSITHDGDYKCEIAASEGNFQCGYHLQVLVPPEVTLVSSKNRTATCKAAGAKPAAQISWTPEGHCITEQEHLDNGTVTVQSTCLWSDSNVSAVTCSVSHLAGNKTLSEELNPEYCPLTKGEHPSLTIALNGSRMDGKEKILNNSVPPAEVDIPLFVLMNSKAVLCCPPVSRTYMIGATWEIILRDKPACIKAYKADSNETKDVNCTDRRITWVSRPDQNLSLRIDPVSITHDGDYRCEVAAFEGNFQCGYRLQVLVPPEVTLVPSKNRTATCKAAGGKPAAQISWTPEGHCVTKQELLDNGTVTVRSTCHWSDSNVSAVTCSVSHLAGNKTLSEEVGPGKRICLLEE